MDALTEPVSVLSLEDDPIFQLGLRYKIEEAGMLFHATSDPDRFLELVAQLKPTVTLHDLRLNGNDEVGLAILPQVVFLSPSTRRIVLTGHPTLDGLRRVLEYAVEGYLQKNGTDIGTVIAAIHRVADGGSAHDTQLLSRFLSEGSSERFPLPTMIRLTPREREVLRLVLNGQTYKEMASSLQIGLETIKSHLKTAGEKLNTSGKLPTALKAQRLQLL